MALPANADAFADAVVAAGCYGAPTSINCGPAAANLLVTGAPDSPPASNFIQLSSGSFIDLEFTDNLAYASGNSSPDLILHTIDAFYPAYADVFVSADGLGWTFVGNYADTPLDQQIYIDLDAFGVTYPVRFVRLVETAEDPAYPPLGFDLDAITAVYLNPAAPPFLGCTYTQGYYATHSGWTAPAGEYSWFSMTTLQKSAKGGDAWLILAQQYIAAVLNRESGAGVPPDVAPALTDAKNLLGPAQYSIGKKSQVRAQAVSLSVILDSYNNGFAGVPHCG
ncbi:TPA: hypothetical protein HA244_06110 [Candidatus Micrarchaeota archaeon]|nr:hypothetical protein [Candidatus Micrarchaeota archaeon]